MIFVYVFQLASDPKWRFDDVLGVWPLHGLCGLWGGIACGIFGLKAFGGLGGVSFFSQLVGSLMGAAFGALAGFIIYALVDMLLGLAAQRRGRAARRRPGRPQDRRQPGRGRAHGAGVTHFCPTRFAA